MSRSHMPGPMQEIERPVSALEPDDRNPRSHPDAQVEAIAASMDEFGQDQPIVALPDGRIVKGEGRWLAAKMLGWDTVAVVEVDEDELAALRRNLADHGAMQTSYLDERVVLRLVTEIGAAHGEEPIPGLDDDFLRRLRLAAGVGGESDEAASDEEWAGLGEWREQAAEQADQAASQVATISIGLEPDDYRRVTAVLDEVIERQSGVENYTQAAVYLLTWWAERQNADVAVPA